MKLILLFLLFLPLTINRSYCGWVKQKGESQIIFKAKSSSFSTVSSQNLIVSNKIEPAQINVKTNLTQYDMFAEVGLTKRLSFVFLSLVSQLQQNIDVKSQSYHSNYTTNNMVTNYIGFGLRRQIFRRWGLASGIQVAFFKPGSMSDEQKRLFGYQAKTIEIRHMLGIGSGEAFLNRAVNVGLRKRYRKPTKFFAIIENGVRDNSYYNFRELRNDYTMGYELTELGSILLLQATEIYQFSYGQQNAQYQASKTSNLALRKFSFSTINKINKNIWLGFSMERETRGFISKKARTFSLDLWISSD